MNHRAIALGLACLASFLTQGAAAQGLRPSGAAGTGLSRMLPAAPSFTLPASGASTALRQADFIVAVVNSEPVTNNEVRARATRIAQQMAQQGAALPPADVLAREVLERLILEKIQLQLAREVGMKVDDFAVGQAEESVAKQNNVSLAEMHRRLAADGISKERFREELRNQLLLQRLRERDVQSRVRVSDLDVDQYLREQQSGADASRLDINLGHILVAVPENASPAQVSERQARAQRAADKVRAGEDFAAVAAEFSDSPEAKTAGGLLGMRPADRYPELFVSATAQLPVGGIAGPVRSGAGFHVLKLADKSTTGIPTLVTQHHVRHILLHGAPAHRKRRRSAAGRLPAPHRRGPGRLCRIGARALTGWQRQAGRRSGLGQSGPLRARVRAGRECTQARRHQRAPGVAFWRAPDPAGRAPRGQAHPA